MNQNWKNFLIANNGNFINENIVAFKTTENTGTEHIYPLPQFAMLSVSGNDAAVFLQGQTTCDINTVDKGKSLLGGFCNSKGKTITTFLIIHQADKFLLILPAELLDSVKKRLQMYVLRSKVQISDCSQNLCLIGLCCNRIRAPSWPQSLLETTTDPIILKYPSRLNRYLIAADTDKAQAFWLNFVQNHHYTPADSALWGKLDIQDGIPWLGQQTSEAFIPQMINLDRLGGVSFNKGCYTGQEIVARTHYLGKNKRQMYYAECHCESPPQPYSAILDSNAASQQSFGKVLAAHHSQGLCQMLIVLQSADYSKKTLMLDNEKQDKISVSELPARVDIQ